MKKIFINLDGGKKLSLGTLDSLASRRFRLRSVDENQYQARINVGLMDDYNSYELKSFYLDKLKPSSNGYSYMECLLNRDGRRLELIIKNAGRTVCRESFSILPRKLFYRNIALLLGAVLLIAGLTFFFLTFDFSSMGAGQKSSYAEPQRVSRERETSEATGQPPKEESSPAVTEKAPRTIERTVPVSDEGKEEALDTSSEPLSLDSSSVEVQVIEVPEAAEAAAITGKSPSEEISSPPGPDFSLLDKNDLVLYFTPNSSYLEPNAIHSLENVLSFLLDYPTVRVKITGHCAIAGTEAGRREISVDRAVNVERWLRKGGWKPVFPPQVNGEAGNFPLTRDPENQEINRRVEIDLSE